MKLEVKKLDPRAKLPSYAHPGDAGLDLFALETVTIPPRSRQRIHTGVAIVIPQGYVGLVWDKGGPSFKYGLTSVGGVFDAGFTGEYILCLYNTTDEPYTFSAGEKVAQLLVQAVERVDVTEIDQLPATSRADGAFGSTGK
jgi:dUTP pyrophosphatase